MKKWSATKSKGVTQKKSVHPGLKGTTAQKSIAHKIQKTIPNPTDIIDKTKPKYSDNAKPVNFTQPR